MYSEYWKLSCDPFEAISSGRSFFQCAAQEESLARIDFLIQQNRRVGLLLGRPGLGKSSVLRHVCHASKRRGCSVGMINVFGMDEQEFLHAVARVLGCPTESESSAIVLWRETHDALLANCYEQKPTVLCFDDVHEADTGVLNGIIRLAQWQPPTKPLVSLILGADSDRVSWLGERILDRCEMRIELEPWNRNDTLAYVHAAALCGGSEKPLFDGPSIDALHDCTQGNPRQIRQLAEFALVAAASQSLAQVDLSTLQACEEELRFACETA